MFISTALALAGTVSLTAAQPFGSTISARAVASFPAGTTFDILLNKENVDQKTIVNSKGFSVIDIDLFDNSKSTIASYKASGKKVICYFSAGTREDWRNADKDKFKKNDYGQAMDEWAGENWVNVKSDNVKAIMKARIKLAKDNGCDGVDPDNTDGYNNNQDGWGYDRSDYIAYFKYLAKEAAAQGLAIGLKNSVDMITDVEKVVQFAVNESCHQWDNGRECERYKPMTDANKAVFNVEYGHKTCQSPAGVKLTIVNKNGDQKLNTLGGQCSAT